MINEITLGAYIAEAFIPSLPFIAAGVVAFILVSIFLVMFRGFLPEDQ